jgi:hypothetical protein
MISRAERSPRQSRTAGAYYTREDVTGYIAERTILPVVLDAVAAQCPAVFAPGSPAWQLLAQDPDRYIPAALAHGPDRLPTETVVEWHARRQRCDALRRHLRAGHVHCINDLVTFNLDIRRWTQDVIAHGDTELRGAFAEALANITILDPTCGDGAFLQAGLRILETLALCVGGGGLPAIRRSILRRNLYGVDVRAKAVGECRRNLLQSLTELDPDAELPDLSGTILCGNALTGAVTADGWCVGGPSYLAFAPVMQRGGFDAIVGNPPYVAAERAGYRVKGFVTAGCPDVYAWVLERAAQLLRPGGRSGMIVPLSLAFSGDFAACRQMVLNTYDCNWFASFGRIPAALFAFDIRVRNVIHLGRKGDAKPQVTFGTRLHRWFEQARPQLFPLLAYAPFDPAAWDGRVPKLGSARLTAALQARLRRPSRLGDSLVTSPTPHWLHYKQTAYNWLTFCRRLPPCYDARGRPLPQTQFDTLYFRTAWQRDAAMLLLNGKWAFAFWIAVGDDFHVARWMIADFPMSLEEIPLQSRKWLGILARRLERAMQRATAFKRNAGKRVGTYNLARCRAITDQSDRLFAVMLGLEDAWPDVELLCAQVVKTEFGE